jgi:RNA polymerase sigma-70 factor, ECF subfamily
MTDTDMHGGHARFEALYERHREPVMRYALRRVGPDHAADVVAETFLVALRKPDSVPTDNELPWLYAVARNHIRNHRRTEQKWFSVDAAATQSRDYTTDVPAGLDLRSAFARLDFDDAEVLRLIAWEGLAPRAAATVLGCSAPTFRVRLHRARRRLRDELDHPTNSSTTKGHR